MITMKNCKSYIVSIVSIVSIVRIVIPVTPFINTNEPWVQWRPSRATWTRASLKQAPPPRSVSVSGTSAFEVDPL
jgi:hypothetical protein